MRTHTQTLCHTGVPVLTHADTHNWQWVFSASASALHTTTERARGPHIAQWKSRHPTYTLESRSCHSLEHSP